jgi:hypothetical protein
LAVAAAAGVAVHRSAAFHADAGEHVGPQLCEPRVVAFDRRGDSVTKRKQIDAFRNGFAPASPAAFELDRPQAKVMATSSQFSDIQ